MEYEGILRTRVYGERGYMENEGIWCTRVYGEGGYIEYKGIWRTRVYGERGYIEYEGILITRVYGERGYMEKEGIWCTRVYGVRGYMENEGIWRTRVYGVRGYMENEGIWRRRMYPWYSDYLPIRTLIHTLTFSSKRRATRHSIRAYNGQPAARGRGKPPSSRVSSKSGVLFLVPVTSLLPPMTSLKTSYDLTSTL